MRIFCETASGPFIRKSSYEEPNGDGLVFLGNLFGDVLVIPRGAYLAMCLSSRGAYLAMRLSSRGAYLAMRLSSLGRGLLGNVLVFPWEGFTWQCTCLPAGSLRATELSSRGELTSDAAGPTILKIE